jgi:hypothetical protein
MAIESPQYDVLRHDGNFELRKYTGYLIASIDVKSDSHSTAGSQAFRYLADYIYGNNELKNQIPMTAPVSTTYKKGTYTVSFTMPSGYSLKTLPKPNNANIKVESISTQNMAVVKFSGFTSESKIDKKVQELKAWCNEKKIKVSGDPIVSRFDMPLTPGFLRHNEISLKAS